MTYPQTAPLAQQQYPGYPPVQHVDPRYAPQPPQGYPGANVTYPQPPAPQQPQQQYAGPQQGQGITPPTPQLNQGSGGGGAASPKLRHLIGRTIIVEPIRVDETAMDTNVNPPVSKPEAYFHLTVVDGGPLQYGDNQSRNPQEQHPNTHEIDTPCRFTNANDNGGAFVKACRDALNAGEVGRIGVVQYGTRGNKPPLITKCNIDVHDNPRPDGDARYAAAMVIFDRIWKAKHGGAPFVSPEPRNLVVPPSQPQPQVAYGAPAQQAYAGYPAGAPQGYAGYAPAPQPPAQPYGFAQQQYAQNGTVPTPYGNAPATDVHPAYAAAATGGAYPAGYGQYAPAGAPQSAPPSTTSFAQAAAPELAQMGAQVPPAVQAWLNSLPEAQRAGALAQYLAQQTGQNGGQQAAQPAGPGI